MWSQDKLKQAVDRRKSRAQELAAVNAELERAALAYARWTGMTEEIGVDTAKEKDALDEIIAAMQPDQWTGLKRLLGKTDDRVLAGLMTYSLQQAQGDLKRQVRELEDIPDWDEAQSKAAEPPRPSKRRRKTRSRGR